LRSWSGCGWAGRRPRAALARASSTTAAIEYLDQRIAVADRAGPAAAEDAAYLRSLRQLAVWQKRDAYASCACVCVHFALALGCLPVFAPAVHAD
jgi:hypothetical protein